MSVGKQALVDALVRDARITRTAAEAVLKALTSAITKELKKGGSVAIAGFGTFRVSKRKARTGVNPQNPSQKIAIPARKAPVFKAGSRLKATVR